MIFFFQGFKEITIILLSCKRWESTPTKQNKSAREESNLKQEAEVNLVPGNFVSVQTIQLLRTLPNYHNLIYGRDIKFTWSRKMKMRQTFKLGGESS